MPSLWGSPLPGGGAIPKNLVVAYLESKAEWRRISASSSVQREDDFCRPSTFWQLNLKADVDNARAGIKPNTEFARNIRNKGDGHRSEARRRDFDHHRVVLMDPVDFFFRPSSFLRRGLSQVPSATDRPWIPAVEIEYGDGNLVVSAELPGLTVKEVNVEIINGLLIIQGERKSGGGRRIRRTERRYGRFYREVALPEGVDAEHTRAEFRNGVLRTTIPIADAPSITRRIPISVTGPETSASQNAHKTGAQTENAA